MRSQCVLIGHPIRTLIILVQDKNTSLKLPVGVSPLQLVDLHRNQRYFIIKLHTWFCLSYFLKTNIKFDCIYQYFMSINSFFNAVSVSRYSRPITNETSHVTTHAKTQWPVTHFSTFYKFILNMLFNKTFPVYQLVLLKVNIFFIED